MTRILKDQPELAKDVKVFLCELCALILMLGAIYLASTIGN